MYKRDLDNLLNTNNQLPKSIMFFGECDYYIEHYTTEFLKRVGENISLLKMYYGEFDLQTAKTHLGESSLFGDRNVLIVKTDKKIDTKSLKALMEAVSKTPSSIFILHYLAEDGKAKSKAFNTKGVAEHVRFFKPNPSEAMGILTKIAREKGIKASTEVLSHLLTLHSMNISMALPDLDKIALLKEGDNSNDAMSLISGQKEADIFALCESLILKRPFTPELARILQEGENEVQIVSAINGIFVQLFMFRACARIKGLADSKDFLGYKLPPQIEQKRAALSLKVHESKFKEILKSLNSLELILKTDQKVEKKALLISTLIHIQSLFD